MEIDFVIEIRMVFGTCGSFDIAASTFTETSYHCVVLLLILSSCLSRTFQIHSVKFSEVTGSKCPFRAI
jgi:hypothetical protein